MQTDSVQHFIFENSAIRGEIVRLDRSYHTISQQRPYPSPVLQFLGETLVVNVLLTSALKFEGQTTIQMKQEGPLQMLVAKCNHHLHIRGLAQWDETSSNHKLGESFKSGQLVITLQPDHRVDFYQSVVKMDNQSIAQVMEHFFLQSDQIPTRLWLAVNDKLAVGLMIQQLGQEDRDQQEKNALWDEVTTLTDTITQDELLTLDNQTLLQRLYHEHDVRLFSPKPVEFRCGCNLTKMESAILTMGPEEVNQLLNQYKKVVVTCEYCNNVYSFSEAEVRAVLAHH